MRKRQGIREIILILLIIATIGFIFTQSMMNKEQSSAESSWVLELITPFLEIFLGKGNVTEHLVRKLAHFTEFAVLGIETSLLFGRKKIVLPLFIPLLTALTDETIQSFTGRGDDVRDVWIDFVGACFGYLVGRVVQSIVSRRKKK